MLPTPLSDLYLILDPGPKQNKNNMSAREFVIYVILVIAGVLLITHGQDCTTEGILEHRSSCSKPSPQELREDMHGSCKK